MDRERVIAALYEGFWDAMESNPDPMGAYADRDMGLVDGHLPSGLFGEMADAVLDLSRPISRRQVERLTDDIEDVIKQADYLDFGVPDTRDMAERSVNAVFAFFGLEGEKPADE